jgi:hypothetical protein
MYTSIPRKTVLSLNHIAGQAILIHVLAFCPVAYRSREIPTWDYKNREEREAGLHVWLSKWAGNKKYMNCLRCRVERRTGEEEQAAREADSGWRLVAGQI